MPKHPFTAEMAAELLQLAGLEPMVAEVRAAPLNDYDDIANRLTDMLAEPLSAQRRALLWASREILDKLTLAS